jgi:hypothetical protein
MSQPRLIFDDIDEGKIPFAKLLSNAEGARTAFLQMAVLALILWAVMGFDSTWEMMNPLFDALFVNPITAIQQLFDPASPLRAAMWSFYGMGDHWSAAVIYGFAFVGLSLYLEVVGIKKSRNFFITTCLSLGNIGIFELMWNSGYAIFQGQWWAITFAPKQLYNLMFFVSFVFLMILGFVTLYGFGYRINMTRDRWFFVGTAAALWIFWILYPFPIQHITVQTDWGPWTNSNLFPQTYYVVDTTNNGYAAGIPNWVENNLLHAVNTLCKMATTLAILGICMVGMKKK